MKTSAVVLHHSDTKCLPIGNRDEGKTQRKVEGWIKSMTDRGGGTEGDAGDGPLGGGRTLHGGQIWLKEIILKPHNYITILELITVLSD